LQLFDAEEHTNLWSSEHTPLVFTQSPFFLHSPNVLLDGHRYRFALSPVSQANRQLYLVRVGTSLDFIEEDVGNVTQIAAPVLAGVFLLAPLGGYVLARRATRPLQRLIAASRQLHPTRLEERLPLRNTGDELDQLSGDINHFLDQIAEFIKRNREFLANAAHEIRSPLTAMLTSIEVTLSQPRSVAQYQEVLTQVQERGRNLANLANQLLLLAESDAGLLATSQSDVSIDRVVLATVDMFLGVAEEKNVALVASVTPDLLIRGEKSRLQQVVNNLVDNAIKFTPSGGRVEIGLALSSDRAKVCLTVNDSGIGIEESVQPRIFERFFQANPSRVRESRDRMGFGLGLSICRSIVQAYQGQISLTSQRGVGTIFRVEFPAIFAETRKVTE
jgi:signal transduction histidine kinase